MLNLLDSGPATGILIGIALLAFGLLSGRAVLAVAGAVVLVASAGRWMSRRAGGKNAE
jgi:hypothetical protein